jgi:hypothetical protein
MPRQILLINYDANADPRVPIGGTSATPVQKEEPKKTVEPVSPPSQSVSISDSAHRRMCTTGHMSMQLQTVSETLCNPIFHVPSRRSQHKLAAVTSDNDYSIATT